MRAVRTSDRRVVEIPADATELLAAPSPSSDVVEAVANAIWYEYARDDAPPVGQGDESMWMRYARAAIAAFAAICARPAPLIVLPADLTEPQVTELRAEFERLMREPASHRLKVLPRQGVTRAQVRDAAHQLFLWNTEHPNDPKFVLHHVAGGCDREPYGALVDEVLHHLSIPVQEGHQP